MPVTFLSLKVKTNVSVKIVNIWLVAENKLFDSLPYFCLDNLASDQCLGESP